MRRMTIVTLCLGSAIALSGCDRPINQEEVEKAVSGVNVIDETGLSDIMLTAGDPDEAVAYFTRSAAQNPDRIDLKRSLAKALIRARKPAQAATVWAAVTEMDEATPEDSVGWADALIRAGDWTRAGDVLNTVPPTHETFDRYRLEAMVADAKEDWKRADSFYEIAQGLTTNPSGVLNNWGFSKLTRGDYKGAEQLFTEALSYQPDMFTAKNNLMMARGAQRRYDLPPIQMTQIEKAQLLYTLGLAAIKQGDVAMGKTLLQDAVETHPQHFEEAARALAALDSQSTQG